ncbi:MAG: undecaprenyl-diphosphate phosphatase [Planctomycetota bacterium]
MLFPRFDSGALPDFESLSLLALLQGLTEFLPVSSSGHLVLTQAALGFDRPAIGVDVALHVGTLLAVLVVYRADLLRLVKGALSGDLVEPLLIVLGTIPAAVIGLTFRDSIHGLFEKPMTAAWGLVATSGILITGELARRRGEARAADAEARGEDGEESQCPRWHQALLIGVSQALAILPGISRSGTTIACGLLLGLRPAAAARFSFLLAIPTILGAAVLELPGAMEETSGGGLAPLIWATLFAGFVGWGAMRMLLAFLARGAFAWFSVYCLVLGAGVLLFLG